MFTTYNEFIDFMATQKDRVYSLDNFQKYMNAIDNPQYALSCIHIGGTNGKGSTLNYVKEVLVQSGYKIGTFVSPPLISRLDIIQINGIAIDEKVLVDIANTYVDEWLEYGLSIFEIEMCISVFYFIQQKVDYVLYEVGLGGTLDATNIIRPMLSVNTNVGMDHIEFLGDTYASIARNKAGIVKDNVPYIVGEGKAECIEVFKEVCSNHNSELCMLEKIHNISVNPSRYTYRSYDIELDAIATYQIQNSALAIEVLYQGKKRGCFTYDDKTLVEAIKHANWKGRFEVVMNKPTIIIDGAHNKEGIEAFVQSAREYPNSKIIFGAFKDKDHQFMLQSLLAISNDITVCPFDHVRSASIEQLTKLDNVKSCIEYKDAIDEAMNQDKVVFITGSLYFISLARAYILEKKEESTL